MATKRGGSGGKRKRADSYSEEALSLGELLPLKDGEDDEADGEIKPTSVRIPPQLLGELDMLAKRTGVSRAKVIVRLLMFATKQYDMQVLSRASKPKQ